MPIEILYKITIAFHKKPKKDQPSGERFVNIWDNYQFQVKQ